MRNTVLIIDDQKEQAQGIAKVLNGLLPNFSFEALSVEEQILDAVDNRFYMLAIVDIRMDKFSMDGIDIVKRIFAVNPMAKVLIVSAFKGEYFERLKDVLLSGRVLDVLDKKPISQWGTELRGVVEKHFNEIEANSSEISSAWLNLYAEVKNEANSVQKGERFERFVSMLFQSIGYNQIQKRVIDKSRNEVDLLIRNEIDDLFLNKFGKYILVECKNKPNDKVGKNDFIVFRSKLENTHGLADLGILATSGNIARTTYLEAIRSSSGDKKVLFLSNGQFLRLIMSNDIRKEFKKIVDEQVKDT